jgi:hypothetical protein
MALGAIQPLVLAGITPSYATPAASENVTPGGSQTLFLHVKNANASACVVTLVDPGLTPAGSVATNPTVSVPGTTGDKMIPLDLDFFNPATGFINITFSVQTSVTAGLFRL